MHKEGHEVNAGGNLPRGKNHDARTDDDSRFTAEHYGQAAMEMDGATALNEEAQELNALCVSVIQFDGPVFGRVNGALRRSTAASKASKRRRQRRISAKATQGCSSSVRR